MAVLKVTSWNVAHLDRLLAAGLSPGSRRRRDAVAREIREIAPDILCLLEGPRGEAGIDRIAAELLGGDYVAVKAADGQYATAGEQWIWFLVHKKHQARASLLPTSTWDAFCGQSWPCHFWGDFAEEAHKHYRHPQVLVFDWNGVRVEFIGLHLKSKFVNRGESMWAAGGEQRQTYIREALKARVKMTTEAANVRAYIDAKFRQVENPAIFVMGDLNDGPGKEYFEDQFLFFDLVSSLQGDVFFASKFLNHALFDYAESLRWTVQFQDFVEPSRDPRILLDHIMFTQSLVNGSLPWHIEARAGLVEHEIHELVNAALSSAQRTSDHRPVSCRVTIAE